MVFNKQVSNKQFVVLKHSQHHTNFPSACAFDNRKTDICNIEMMDGSPTVVDTGYSRHGVAANSSSSASSEEPAASTAQSTSQAKPPSGTPRPDTPELDLPLSDSGEDEQPPQRKSKMTRREMAAMAVEYQKQFDKKIEMVEKQQELIIQYLQDLLEESRESNRRQEEIFQTIADKLDRRRANNI